MIWGYLGEFWDNITESVASTTENLIQYPVSFFENIGDAVGGSIGGLFDQFLHQLNDIVIFGSYIMNRSGEIFSNLSIPFTYIFYFFKNIFGYALGTPETAELTYTWSAGVLGIFQHVPYWDTLGLVIGAGLTIIGGLAVFKTLLKI